MLHLSHCPHVYVMLRKWLRSYAKGEGKRSLSHQTDTEVWETPSGVQLPAILHRGKGYGAFSCQSERNHTLTIST